MTKPLTRSDFIARKAELSGHLTAAQDAYRHAAAKREAGEVDDAAVAAARQTVTTLQERLEGLEAAWEVEEERQRVAAKRANAATRRAAFADTQKALADRLAAAEKLMELRTAVEVEGQRYADATRRVLSSAWSHYSADRRGLADRRTLMQFEDAQLSIERATITIGNLPGSGKDIGEFVRRQNGRLEAELSSIVPDAEDEKQAA